MNSDGSATTPDWGQVLIDSLGHALSALAPLLPWLLAIFALLVLLAGPLPGRGPGFFQGRDPWRGFRFDARRAVLARAGGRCEEAVVLAWLRCRQPAEEVDHIYPWSKRGATIVSNGQALCSAHNRAKSNRTPAWWYVIALERRRKTYCTEGTAIRVSAAMSAADRAARAASAERKGRR